MRSKDSRLVNSIFSDPWRKLASLGLAILLWQFLDNLVTKTAVVTPKLHTTGNTQTVEQSRHMYIYVQESKFTLDGFYDAQTDLAVKQVKITLRGATHLVEDFGENRGFSVESAFKRMPEDSTAFEFELEDVLCSNQRFQGLLFSMEPKSVRVRLDKNEEISIVLGTSTVRFMPTGKIANFHEVVDLENAKYTTGNILFSGRSTVIRELENMTTPFVVDFDDISGNISKTSARGKVRLAPSSKGRFEELHQTPGDISVTVPIRPQFIEFSFKDIPILIDEVALPPNLRGKFSIDMTSGRVEIKAINRLVSEWSGLRDDAAKKQWILDHGVRLLAQIPADFKDKTNIVTRLVIPGNDFVEETDYQVTYTDSVTVTAKKQ